MFAVALAIRLLHIWQIHDAPFAALKLGDAATYDAWARRIAAGDWIGHEVFYQAPLYPYFLALVYSLFGTSVTTVRVCQAVVSAAACALLAGAGARLLSRPAGIAAGLMLAIYPPAVFLDTLLQKSALDVFFLCLALWLVASLVREPRRSIAIWLGAALGLLALTRENALALALPILLWIGVSGAPRRTGAAHSRIALVACLLAGVAAVLVPIAIRNDLVGGGFFVTTSQFGTNFYIGNNERADGTYQPLVSFRGKAAFEQADATALAERTEGRTMSPAEVSAYYTRQAFAFIRAHPAAWLRLLWRKFVLAWNRTEIPDTEDQYTYADWSLPLRLDLVWNLGMLVPISAIGIWITAPDWRRLWILHAMLAVYVASIVAFYVFARYRFPIVPLLMLFGGAALARWRELAPGPTASIVGCAGVAVGAAVFANWPTIPHGQLEAVTHYNFGVGFAAAGNPDAAIAEYRSAARLDPRLAIVHSSLGYLLASRGDLAGAERELSEAIRLLPAYAPAHSNLGVVLGREGRYEAALKELGAAAQADPSDVEPHRNAAAILAALGRTDEAITEYERALALAPDAAGLRNDAAILLARRGRVDEAADELRRAIASAPDRADLHANLGLVLAQLGELEAAAAELRQALAIDPAYEPARRALTRLEHERKAGAR